jgi:hypothetical protein
MKPTDPDEYDESQIERHNELEAYNIANGVAKVNPIINQEGMINLVCTKWNNNDIKFYNYTRKAQYF